ncbi:MAG: FKBP-type peptidyl-prolyl cis-trans isomerase [Candidatus Saccharibacteria bacterium]|nr:FKBP-type peptidyl-prolyl cis-trans isomerase [Candidatus Saccharibacteria bacterium]
MIVNNDRKTTPKQRIIVALIAIVLLGSTFALYAGIVLGYKNTENQQTISTEKTNRFNELYADYQNREDAQARELSKKYFDTFKARRTDVKAFNAAGVNTLTTKDIVVGTGREIKSNIDENGKSEAWDTDYAAYYIGWLSDETIFDSSFDSTENPAELKSPLTGSSSMIQGWLEGIEGMRIGGIREITIPAVLGYGDTAQGTIPANSPLKFIVMMIEKPEALEVSDELEQLANELYGYSFRQQ